MARLHSTLRTRVYVDGYNLYYGCLRKTPHKWLDLKALFGRILAQTVLEVEGHPAHFVLEPLSIKYFTASILKNFAKGHDSVACQERYHKALRGHLDESLEIISGYYSANQARAFRYEEGRPARECELVDIWKLEEKQSDVALALHAYADAIKDAETCRESGGTDSVCLKGHEDSMKEVRERERKAVAERDARIAELEKALGKGER